MSRAERVRARGGQDYRVEADRARANRFVPLNWLIRQASLVTWYDLFDGNGDSRDFDQVVQRKGLTVAQLVKAGIVVGVARRAVGLGPLGK